MSITSQLFLISFTAGNLMSLTINPVFGIITCISTYFINPPSSWWYDQVPHLRYALIGVLVLAVSFLRRFDQYRSSRLLSVPHFRVLLLLMAVVGVSYFWSVNHFDADRYLVIWLKICIFVFLAYKVVLRSQELDWVLMAYCAACFYTGFHAWEFGRRFGSRLEMIKLADGTDGNGLAIALLLSVPILVFYISWGKRRWLRIAALTATAFVVNALVLINSRGAFLGLIGSLVYFGMRVVWEKKNFKMLFGVAMAGVLCYAGLLYLADQSFWRE